MVPSISIVIPTYNEQQHIDACLRSVYMQDYPKKLLEVILVDNFSTDQTVAIAKRYPITLVMSKVKNNHVSKMIAFRRAKGDLFYYMDADLEFVSKDYIKLLVHALQDDPRIVGASGKVVQAPNDISLNRFLTYELHQRDPVLEFFSPPITSTIVAKKPGYYLCKYKLERIPPIGRCLFWRKKLLQTPIAKAEKFLDLDNIVMLVHNGFPYFAFVPDAMEYHRHVENLGSLVRKRLRNITHNFLPHYETRLYTWFEVNTTRDVVRMLYWIVYAHLLLPAFVRGCYKAIRHRDIVCIWYEPVLTLLLTDISLWGFVTSDRGLQFISRALKRNLWI